VNSTTKKHEQSIRSAGSDLGAKSHILLGDHVRRLHSIGSDVDRVEKNGQLERCEWNRAYFPDGRLYQDRRLKMWQGVLEAAGLKGYSRLILGGILKENPFFVPPEQFLRERRERRAIDRDRN
jgi:hypothetical protein